jgi:hypothetical protein
MTAIATSSAALFQRPFKRSSSYFAVIAAFCCPISLPFCLTLTVTVHAPAIITCPLPVYLAVAGRLQPDLIPHLRHLHRRHRGHHQRD